MVASRPTGTAAPGLAVAKPIRIISEDAPIRCHNPSVSRFLLNLLPISDLGRVAEDGVWRLSLVARFER